MAFQEEGVDLSWARPGGAALVAAGKKFVIRYLYPDGQGGKGLDGGELADYLAHGLEVPVVYESYAGRAKEGRAAGEADAKTAQHELEALGLPSGMPIYFAVDYDAPESDQPAIDEYLRGVASVISLERTGVYAGYWIIKRCHENNTATWLWQTYAWSGGNLHPAAHLYQYRNGQNIGGAVDFTRALQENYGQPSKFGNVQPAPQPPTPAPAPPAAGSYTLARAVPGYVSAADAASRKNSNSTAPAGTYAVFNQASGMINVTRVAGQPGWWINPGDNTPQPSPAPPTSNGAYTVNRSIPGYVNAGDAAKHQNSNSMVPVGTYSIFNQSQGMLNVTRQAGSPGWWINPSDNGGAAPAPAPSKTYTVTSRDYDGLAAAMGRIGISDWKAVASLNGLNPPYTIYPNQVLRLP